MYLTSVDQVLAEAVAQWADKDEGGAPGLIVAVHGVRIFGLQFVLSLQQDEGGG